MYAKSLQSCPTLCDPIDSSPPGSPVPGILQARTLEWAAIAFSNAWEWKVKAKSLSHVRLFATLWTAAHQAPLSMGFSKQEYWSGVPLPFLKVWVFPNETSQFYFSLHKPFVQVFLQFVQVVQHNAYYVIKLWGDAFSDTLPSKPPGKPQSIIKTTHLSFVCVFVSGEEIR